MSGWLFLVQQGLSAWSLLLALGMCMGLRRPCLWRISLTALACGGVTLCCAGTPWRLVALALVTVLAPPAAWPGVPRSRRPGMALACLTLTVLMAGCGRLLQGLGLGRTPLVLGQAGLLPLLLRLTPPASRAACVQLEITHRACRMVFTALVDTGNLLRDPITRLPVIVLSRRAAARLNAGVPAVRLIPVRTVAGKALMPVFRPGRVRVLSAGGWQAVHAVVGIGPDESSGFQALVPGCALSPVQGGEALCP